MIYSPRQVFDVLIVGGGPAGSSLATRLARAGLRVAVLDAREFPRSKPCGDAVSPGATPLLEELGLSDLCSSAGATLLEGWRIRAHDGSWIDGRFSDRDGPPAGGLAIDRRVLDATLLGAARAAGVQVFERRRAIELIETSDARTDAPRAPVRELLARGPTGKVERYRARFVVGADGLRSRVARWLGPIRRGPNPRLALVARFRGVRTVTRFGELRLSDEGVLGYAPTSERSCNITLVVPAATGRALRPDPRLFLLERLRQYGAEPLVRGGQLDRPIEVTGPFQLEPARKTAPGVLLVGDAAGYFDPFTGQGVYRALLGAKLAARTIERGLETPTVEEAALVDYETALDAHIAPSRRLQRAIDHVISEKRLMNSACRVLRRRTRLTSRLVDAAGDRIPPHELLRPAPWLGALLVRGPAAPVPQERDAYA